MNNFLKPFPYYPIHGIVTVPTNRKGDFNENCPYFCLVPVCCAALGLSKSGNPSNNHHSTHHRPHRTHRRRPGTALRARVLRPAPVRRGQLPPGRPGGPSDCHSAVTRCAWPSLELSLGPRYPGGHARRPRQADPGRALEAYPGREPRGVGTWCIPAGRSH